MRTEFLRSSWLSALLVALISGCDGKPGEPLPEHPLLIQSGQEPQSSAGRPLLVRPAPGAPSDSQVVAGRQRRLLESLVSDPDSAAAYIASKFTFVDGPDTAAVTRNVLGQQVLGSDFLRVLSQRFTPEFARISKLDVFTERAGFAVSTITTHESGRPTVTAWERVAGDWKAVRMMINTPDQRVADIRARYSLGWRAQS
jgi:hypothetical protein